MPWSKKPRETERLKSLKICRSKNLFRHQKLRRSLKLMINSFNICISSMLQWTLRKSRLLTLNIFTPCLISENSSDSDITKKSSQTWFHQKIWCMSIRFYWVNLKMLPTRKMTKGHFRTEPLVWLTLQVLLNHLLEYQLLLRKSSEVLRMISWNRKWTKKPWITKL